MRTQAGPRSPPSQSRKKIARARSDFRGLGGWTEASLQHRPFHPFLTPPTLRNLGSTRDGPERAGQVQCILYRGGKENPEKASHLPKATQRVLKAECGVNEKHLWPRRETWVRSHLSSAGEAAPCTSASPSSPGRDCMALQSLLTHLTQKSTITRTPGSLSQ